MYRRRMYRRARRYGVPRPIRSGETALTLRRSGQPTAVTLSAGGVIGLVRPKLSDCVTSDLTSVFREYRVLKCVVHFTRRIDPAAPLPANTTAILQIALAADAEGVIPTAFNEVTAYSNSKHGTLSADRGMSYTFYPKVINSVSSDPSALTVASVGTYGINPWLQCTATGVSVQMNALLYSILSTLTTDTSVVEYTIDYVFQVRGIS